MLFVCFSGFVVQQAGQTLGLPCHARLRALACTCVHLRAFACTCLARRRCRLSLLSSALVRERVCEGLCVHHPCVHHPCAHLPRARQSAIRQMGVRRAITPTSNTPAPRHTLPTSRASLHVVWPRKKSATALVRVPSLSCGMLVAKRFASLRCTLSLRVNVDEPKEVLSRFSLFRLRPCLAS